MKKKLVILIALMTILVELVVVFSFNHIREAKRNREYEVSLVQALKNSYRDIEEITINDPRYLDKPENWHCVVKLIFF